jgi:hypothetical protein
MNKTIFIKVLDKDQARTFASILIQLSAEIFEISVGFRYSHKIDHFIFFKLTKV